MNRMAPPPSELRADWPLDQVRMLVWCMSRVVKLCLTDSEHIHAWKIQRSARQLQLAMEELGAPDPSREHPKDARRRLEHHYRESYSHVRALLEVERRALESTTRWLDAIDAMIKESYDDPQPGLQSDER